MASLPFVPLIVRAGGEARTGQADVFDAAERHVARHIVAMTPLDGSVPYVTATVALLPFATVTVSLAVGCPPSTVKLVRTARGADVDRVVTQAARHHQAPRCSLPAS